MALTPGARLGPYEVLAQIGVGGMGEVYKATDVSLKRGVAIKVLPESVAADADRLARFQREAEMLAALNHPNIAAIYGLERSGTSTAIAMELVEGPTLADRIAPGAMPVDDALAIAKQITEALEAAHEQGIIHRDLKPANIKVRPDGVVKVLDFGLAKATEPAGLMSISSSLSPTITTPAMTQAGIILGTAAYMSPEQARGRAVDKRSDVWSFGCVLFEMLTGRRAFEAEDITLTLAEVVKSDPDWTALPQLPPTVAMCLRRCFKKDPRQRLRDIGEMRLALAGALESDLPVNTSTSSESSGRAWRWAVPSAAAMASAVGAALVTLSLRPEPLPEIVRFQVHAPAGSKIRPGTPAISPDGRNLAYVVTGADGQNRIHVRNIDTVESRALEGTENAVHPFWSSDGRSLAFVSERVLKRIDMTGGPARQVAEEVTFPWHGSWNQFGDLLYVRGGIGGAGGAGIIQVPGDGSLPRLIVPPDASAGERGVNFPFFLPDGRRFLVHVAGGEGKSSIHLASLDSVDRKLVIDDVRSAPLLAPTPRGRSYLLYLQDDALLAHEFDETSGAVQGEPRTLVRGIGRVARPTLMPTAGVSPTGTLAFQTGDFLFEGFTWLNRAGERLGTVPLEVTGVNPSLSPDGRLIAFEGNMGAELDVWVHDVARGISSRLTRGEGDDRSPMWSPDGQRVAFARSGKIYVKSADGSTDETVLADVAGAPRGWSLDGKHLLVMNQQKLFLWPLATGGGPIPIGPRDASTQDGRLSTDGRFVAYSSDVSGRDEIYVEALPPATGRVRVSANGGTAPRWSGGKPELFFIAADRSLMVADLQIEKTLSAGVPRKLIPLNFPVNVGYDVTGDGQRFLVNSPAEDVPDTPITVVVNWWAELAKGSN